MPQNLSCALRKSRAHFGLVLPPGHLYDMPVFIPPLPDGVTVAQQTLNLFV